MRTCNSIFSAGGGLYGQLASLAPGSASHTLVDGAFVVCFYFLVKRHQVLPFFSFPSLMAPRPYATSPNSAIYKKSLESRLPSKSK